MGIFDSIMGNNKPVAPAPAAPVTPAPTTQGQGSTEPVNPLDVYKGIFDTSKTDESVAPSFKLDDKVLTDVSSKLQFMNGVNPELIQRATNGDASAMLEAMNAVAQNAYKAAIGHSAALTDTHLGARDKFNEQNLGGKVKQELITSQLADVPNFNHPVLKAELVRVASALAKQNPDATPEQIKTEAVRYLTEVQAAMSQNNSNPKPNSNRTAGEIDDWEAFLTS